ncbi:MAG TPA: TerC family protein [Candidatus Udaeobacter sp.]|jgi:tellurite resistance protein TerC
MKPLPPVTTSIWFLIGYCHFDVFVRKTIAGAPLWFWIAFHVGVFVAIAIDLFTFRRRGRELSMGAAARRSVIWIVVSLAFNAVVWRIKGPHHGLDFLTGYLVEYSLSMDNIFVFVLIFTHFRVPPLAQHRVLVWGIIGALIMRGTMICFGIALVQRFDFVTYLFGLFLLITAARMFFGKQPDFRETRVMRFCRRILPITPEFHDEHFKVSVNGRWMLTPLVLTMIVIEITDLAFAVDSIPAVLAITQDKFVAYTSNICAILGLRSLYFLLAGLMNRFIYLRTGLALVLGFVGIKMITAEYMPLPRVVSLGIIVLILGVTIALSMLKTKDDSATEHGK